MNQRPASSHYRVISAAGIVFAAGIALSVIGTAVFAWTGPSQTAPNGNVSAPVNIGTGSQVKNGNLSVNAFTGTQDSIFYGKLNVGSSAAPTYTLDVTGTERVTGQVTLSRDGAGECCSSSNYTLAISENTSSSGRLPTIQFHAGGYQEGYIKLNQTGYRRFLFGDNQSAGMGLETTGNITAPGYYHSSDARLKENVQTSPGLSLIEKLRGVTFDWKKDGAPSAGVIAQEVEKVMPSAVKEDEKGMKTVEYDQLVAPLIEAIKEQQKEIDTLREEIASLKAVAQH